MLPCCTLRHNWLFLLNFENSKESQREPRKNGFDPESSANPYGNCKNLILDLPLQAFRKCPVRFRHWFLAPLPGGLKSKLRSLKRAVGVDPQSQLSKIHSSCLNPSDMVLMLASPKTLRNLQALIWDILLKPRALYRFLRKRLCCFGERFWSENALMSKNPKNPKAPAKHDFFDTHTSTSLARSVAILAQRSITVLLGPCHHVRWPA